MTDLVSIAVAVALVAFVLYVCMGSLLLLVIDSRPRWWGLLDTLSSWQEVLVLALWPIALPYLVLRHDPRA